MSVDERTFYSDANYQPIVGTHVKHAVSPVDLCATITVDINGNGERTQIILATLSVVSISEMRDTFPVSTLSQVAPVGFTRGHRITAGSLVFSVFDRAAFSHAIPASQSSAHQTSVQEALSGTGKLTFYDTPADELPPFDIHMVYTTDGQLVYEGLRGVHIVNQGLARSIDNIALQESYSFLARERIPLQPMELLTSGASPYHDKTKNSPKSAGSLVQNLLGTFLNSLNTQYGLSPQLALSAMPSAIASTNQVIQITAGGVPVTGARVIYQGTTYYSQSGLVNLPTPGPGTYPIQVLAGLVQGTDNAKHRIKTLRSNIVSPGTISIDAAATSASTPPTPPSYE